MRRVTISSKKVKAARDRIFNEMNDCVLVEDRCDNDGLYVDTYVDSFGYIIISISDRNNILRSTRIDPEKHRSPSIVTATPTVYGSSSEDIEVVYI